MYKIIDEARNWDPIPEVPWRDMTDDEYEAVSAHYDRGFPDQPGSLKRWFKHVPDKSFGPAQDKPVKTSTANSDGTQEEV